jgi:2,3,4,5-tetrahydropyridine-2-carboxylate N-succinyltransferase
MNDARDIIEQAFDQRGELSPGSAAKSVVAAVEYALSGLDNGTLRVAEPVADGGPDAGADHHASRWRVNEWLKKAVLLYFRLHPNQVIDAGFTRFFDKVPLKHQDYGREQFERDGARIVPPAVVRRGAFIAADAVLMPCYVNIGAWVGPGSMIDTWATVGSCAQIGARVHISGGAGIGGVLEPLQATPTIIEDDCFIGARSEVVEGVIVERGAVLSMGVFIGQSTRIYDRERDEVSYGRVPAGAVVVPGSLPAEDGRYSLACAVIVKRVDDKTRRKVGINALLRAAAE